MIVWKNLLMLNVEDSSTFKTKNLQNILSSLLVNGKCDMQVKTESCALWIFSFKYRKDMIKGVMN